MTRDSLIGFALAAVTLLGAGLADATPLRVRNGSSVRVALQGKREVGVGLRPHGRGWELQLGVPAAGAVAEIVDVTEGAAAASKWTFDLTNGPLVLDEQTFQAGHAYRVTVRRGTESLGTTLIYLYPPSASARRKVTFDDGDAATNAAGGGSDPIAVSKKPTL
jgi:hypothetical protein